MEEYTAVLVEKETQYFSNTFICLQVIPVQDMEPTKHKKTDLKIHHNRCVTAECELLLRLLKQPIKAHRENNTRGMTLVFSVTNMELRKGKSE